MKWPVHSPSSVGQEAPGKRHDDIHSKGTSCGLGEINNGAGIERWTREEGRHQIMSSSPLPLAWSLTQAARAAAAAAVSASSAPATSRLCRISCAFSCRAARRAARTASSSNAASSAAA